MHTHRWCNVNQHQPLWKTVQRFPKILKIEVSYGPIISLQDICPENMKTLMQKDVCTPMVIALLFTIDKNKKTSDH